MKWLIILFSGVVLALTARSVFNIITTSAPDFDVLFIASKDIPLGLNPYKNPIIFTGVGYPANTLLFYFPFHPFSYINALTLFTVTSLVSLAGSIYVSLKLITKNPKLEYFLLIFSLALLSFPTKFTLGMGQNNLISFFVLLLSYYSFKKQKPALSGILLGLAVAYKTIFGFFFLFFLLKKQFKILYYASLVIIISIGVVSYFSGFSVYQYYVDTVLPPLFNLEGREVYYNQGFLGFLSRITGSIQLRQLISLMFNLAIIGVVGVKTLSSKNDNLVFSFFAISLVLVDSLSWQHHFVWLLSPFVVLSNEVAKRRYFVGGLLILISYLFVSWNFKNPETLGSFPVNLLLSNTFYGTTILAYVSYRLLSEEP